MRPEFFRHNSFVRTIILTALYSILAIATSYAYEKECGTMKLLENLIDKRKQSSYYAKTYTSAEKDTAKCQIEDFYDSVYTIETPHFQINYVLTGPHATTKEFADSTASIMEDAWDFYINKHKMRTPIGSSVTYHFQQKVKEGLYPVEIVEINQIRNNILNGDGCDENFGLTYPFDNDGTSQIFMENDFQVTCYQHSRLDTIFAHGDTCTYATPSYSIRNTVHDFEYAKEWIKGLRVTIFHEFYHSIQLSYISFYVNGTFWFEASATGFEEITNPDIDDYFRYIPSFFDRMGKPLSDTFKNYGASTFFIYLYQKVSKNLDKSIWENYAKNPNKRFEVQIENALKELDLDADSIFHDYSVRLSFSGNRTTAIPEKYWINKDQPQWANAHFYNTASITPDSIKSLAFQFYSDPQSSKAVDLQNYVGKASVVIFHEGKASIHAIRNTKTLDSLTSSINTSDSTIWIFSRLGQSESIPIINNNAAPHAFPVPWKEGSLCFAPLSKDKKFIEIRNRRGDLVSQEKYEGTSYCLTEDQVKSMMAPGMYRFRVGNKGKTTSFIVLY